MELIRYDRLTSLIIYLEHCLTGHYLNLKILEENDYIYYKKNLKILKNILDHIPNKDFFVNPYFLIMNVNNYFLNDQKYLSLFTEVKKKLLINL